jgi:LuxR family maltose regulon positive regulatory protein
MAGTLVATKTFVPRPRPALVPRARLATRLDAGSRAALTLVSAPPGFGKTTVLSSWLASPSMAGRAVAWVSLDEADAQVATFWRYVVTALNAALPEVGASVLPQLESGEPVPASLLTTVLNDLASVEREVELVLDDYHLADGVEVGEGMAFVLDHRPVNLHIVISTRSDPRLPLSRLRARGELVELRAADLRFTSEETAAYLAETHGLVVTDQDVSALESRTEGWAAALQLAVLSMRDRDDVGEFVAGFAGTDRHVVDYLVDEVLSRQSADVRDFLLRSSVLDLVGGDLCDAVLERSGSRAMLESLERANLFLVPMDGERRWHRYHRLFADVLQAHLRAEQPGLLTGLHARASRWFAEAGEPVPAVRHALAAHDVARAADLVEEAMPGLRRRRQEAVLRRWVDDLPSDVVGRRPVLAVGFVGALMACNEFETATELLRVVERALPAVQARLAGAGSGDQGGDGSVSIEVLDEAELARVPAAVELYRAGLALVAGDLVGAQRHAQLTLERASADDDLVRAAASGLSGLASWAAGDLDEACRSYVTCIAGLRRAQHVPDAIGCVLTVAEIRMVQGRLRDALAAYDDGMLLGSAGAGAGALARGAADLHVGCGEVAVERGDLPIARAALADAQRLGEAHGLLRYPYRSRLVAAMIAEAEGDVVGALDLVQRAETVYLGDFSPDVRPLPAIAVRLQLRLGDLDAADRWVHDHRLAPDDALSYLREFEHVTLAEVMLARYRRDRDHALLTGANGLLARLLDASVDGGRIATTLDVLVLQAFAAEAGGDTRTALDTLGRAVALGESEGHVRYAARHGALVLPLLGALARGAPQAAYVGTLLDACRRSIPVPDETAAVGVEAVGPVEALAKDGSALVDPLSERELEVLTLLGSDLGGPDIARHLFISLNTLRTHTKSIYAKLGVSSRREAVRRGRELGLSTR